jgi:PPOX class probable F420-dependent enzyme
MLALPRGRTFVQLDPAALDHVLRAWPVGRLATIGHDATPHLVPIVFVCVDGCIWSPLDGKPKRAGVLQRSRNVERHPAVSLLLDRYDADWRALWWIRIDGIATLLAAEPTVIPSLPRIVEALRDKYPQYRSVAMFSSPPTLLRVRPERHAAWSAQPMNWESL